MKIHEYQSRELLQRFGVPVPGGEVVDSAEHAVEAFKRLQKDGATLAVVKAQVHAGGRGKGGGVKLVKTADECKAAAWKILSKNLVTPQTPPEGVPVRKLLIASGVDIEKEYYLGIVVDRARGCPVLMASSEGGMDIEEVAANTPEKIIKEALDPNTGLQPYQARKVAFQIGMTGKQVGQAVKAMMSLSKLFLGTDASLVEINPLIVTPASKDHPDGQVLAIDAKIDFDDNALFRHKDIQQLEDPAEVDASEAHAAKFGLSYINLDGNIGCLVNGAGLAMSTMDIIKLHGGEPANFLDVGGGATKEQVAKAFELILRDPKVKGILVNIFGGILRCTTLANGIVAAAKELGVPVPLVVRLEGTEVEEGRRILKESGMDIITADDMTSAAQKIVEAAASAS